MGQLVKQLRESFQTVPSIYPVACEQDERAVLDVTECHPSMGVIHCLESLTTEGLTE